MKEKPDVETGSGEVQGVQSDITVIGEKKNVVPTSSTVESARNERKRKALRFDFA